MGAMSKSFEERTGKGIFTSGDAQGENISPSDGNDDSVVITRGSILSYRDKQKRQGLFGNVGTILGNNK